MLKKSQDNKSEKAHAENKNKPSFIETLQLNTMYNQINKTSEFVYNESRGGNRGIYMQSM